MVCTHARYSSKPTGLKLGLRCLDVPESLGKQWRGAVFAPGFLIALELKHKYVRNIEITPRGNNDY